MLYYIYIIKWYIEYCSVYITYIKYCIIVEIGSALNCTIIDALSVLAYSSTCLYGVFVLGLQPLTFLTLIARAPYWVHKAKEIEQNKLHAHTIALLCCKK